ncbi:hypothetical protein EV421DRAFT_1902525 [Armillaria borealis]|uniref:Uncharacterized protein n=1 Tax=Armillaria borealis TaxID=47425 RepID=A0AA39MSX5_9AGAR|nr:hypothetical protein EV421DRAFT_1902525 [Armillaria borealis]
MTPDCYVDLAPQPLSLAKILSHGFPTHKSLCLDVDGVIQAQYISPGPLREGMDHHVSVFIGMSLEDSVTSFIASHLGLDPNAVTFEPGFVGESHHLSRLHHLGRRSCLWVGFHSDQQPSITSLTPSMALEDAIASAKSTLSGSFNEFPYSQAPSQGLQHHRAHAHNPDRERRNWGLVRVVC